MSSNFLALPRPFTIPYDGVVSNNTLCLADVDNDDFDEVIVGCQEGSVAIFKCDQVKPVHEVSDLGPISCLTVGDILNVDKNSLFVTCWNGNSYIFNIFGHTMQHKMSPFLKILLPFNIKSCLIGISETSTPNKLIIASSNYVVGVYVWQSASKDQYSDGKLVCMNKYEFENNIHSIALNGCENFIVSMSRGRCSIVSFNQSKISDDIKPTKIRDSNKQVLDVDLNSQMRSQGCESLVCGNIVSSDKKIGYAIGITSGVVMFLQDDKYIWRNVIKKEIMHMGKIFIPSKNELTKLASAADSKVLTKDDSCSPATSPLNSSAIRLKKWSSFDDNYPKVTSCLYSENFASCPETSTPYDTEEVLQSAEPETTQKNKPASNIASNKPMVVAFCQTGIITIMDCDTAECFEFNTGRSITAACAGFYGFRNQQKPCLAYALRGSIGLVMNFECKLHIYPSVSELLFKNKAYLRALQMLRIPLENKDKIQRLNKFLMYGCNISFDVNVDLNS